MSSKLRLASLLFIVMLLAVIGCLALIPGAQANGYGGITFQSVENNGASSYKGKIKMTFGGTTVIITFAGVPIPPIWLSDPIWMIEYIPDAGYFFHRWETEGAISVPSPNSNPTSMTVVSQGVLRAVYGRTPPSVGGVIMTTNTFTALTPYLTVIGLVATAAVAVKKRRD